MIYSDKYEYVYLAPVKTGTSTMSHVLCKYFDGHIWGENKHDMTVHCRFKDYFKFATVRNPYTHEVSKYLYWHESKMSFEEYLMEHCNESLLETLQQHNAKEPPKDCISFEIDRYLKLETLHADFNNLPFLHKTEEPKMEIRRNSRLLKYKKQKREFVLPKLRRNRKIRPNYTPELMEIVWQRRFIDFQKFNYEKRLPLQSDQIRLL